MFAHHQLSARDGEVILPFCDPSWCLLGIAHPHDKARSRQHCNGGNFSVTAKLLSFVKHTILASFDEEEWRIITLTVGHLDNQSKHTDLFAPSCGSIGDFTDIKKYDEGYVVPPQMRNYNFPVRNFHGAFL